MASIPLIRKSRDSGKLEVLSGGVQALEEGENTNLVCIVGPARSGKSTLANALLGRHRQDAFQVDNTATPCTEGADVSQERKPYQDFCRTFGVASGASDARAPSIQIIDLEGSGDQDQRHDLNLYYPVFLVSKVIIFNFFGYKPRDEFLDTIAPLALAGSSLDRRGVRDERREPPFGHLHIVCRDFHFNQQGGYDAHMMKTETGGGSAADERNRRRALLLSTFSDITFHYFPVLDSSLTSSKALPFAQLPASFKASLNQFAAKIAPQLREPTRAPWAGSALTGKQKVLTLRSALEQIQTSDVIRVADITTAIHGALCREAVARMQKLGEERRALLERAPLMPRAQFELLLKEAVVTMRGAWERDCPAAQMLPSVLAEYNASVEGLLRDYETACRGWHGAAVQRFAEEGYEKARSTLENDLIQDFEPNRLPIPEQQFQASANRCFARVSRDLGASLNTLLPSSAVSGYEAKLAALFKGLVTMLAARNAAAQAHADLEEEKKKATAAAADVQRLKLQVEETERRSQQLVSDHSAWLQRMDDQMQALREEIAVSAQRERERYERNMQMFIQMCMMYGPPVMCGPPPPRVNCRRQPTHMIEYEVEEYDSDDC